jgi:hypothetical protein
MKKAILTGLLIMSVFPCLSQAMPQQQSFKFEYKPLHGDTFTYEISSMDHDEAFKKAADACFNHFKQGRHVSMDEGQDIIDICVNPKHF